MHGDLLADAAVAATLPPVEPVQREDVAEMFGTSDAMVWQWINRHKDREPKTSRPSQRVPTPAPINPGGGHVWDRASWAAWGILSGREERMSSADVKLGKAELRRRAKAEAPPT
jgi:hypothetical protein